MKKDKKFAVAQVGRPLLFRNEMHPTYRDQKQTFRTGMIDLSEHISMSADPPQPSQENESPGPYISMVYLYNLITSFPNPYISTYMERGLYAYFFNLH